MCKFHYASDPWPVLFLEYCHPLLLDLYKRFIDILLAFQLTTHLLRARQVFHHWATVHLFLTPLARYRLTHFMYALSRFTINGRESSLHLAPFSGPALAPMAASEK